MGEFTTVIGLEVHVQLNTTSKAFCSDLNQFGDDPNVNISAVSLALPGTLPVLNEGQVKSAIKLAHALNSTLNKFNTFDRKNYFYPDLPKGYQITQDNAPICSGGFLEFVSGGELKKVNIHHVHMEEDAGKSIHDQHKKFSLVDINRAGTPLLEIVTEPDLRDAQEVHDFIAALQQLVRYLDISDGNMEEGSLRCDVNVSVMPKGSTLYGERNEIKNVNSKKFARTAVEYESKRQIKILKAGGTITKNTLLFDPEKGTTKPMRSKEEVNDYRYFPDPDLPPLNLSESLIQDAISTIEWLPWTAKKALIEEYNRSEYEAEILSREKEIAVNFMSYEMVKDRWATFSNFYINKLLPYQQQNNVTLTSFNQNNVISFVELLDSGKVAISAALSGLSDAILSSSEDIDVVALAQKEGLIQSQDQDFLDEIISEVLHQNLDKVKAFQKGKKGLQGFFMGQVMGKAKGKANPKVLTEKLSKALSEFEV